ncbi:helix-turn-helix transcriptional regulator [Intrasporangium sp.]|uniref:helix-turn-helix transcriptional regulator n=1 Tax=Intrasporangium sp. TaxID=1925024 RepID=UPI00293A2C72|nr:helix-turn-helix domain-containing protein [Intrasporangium sp.]MDV3223060.1 helix-turn-helix domain-containing protein [Intrasporangium sp.]
MALTAGTSSGAAGPSAGVDPAGGPAATDLLESPVRRTIVDALANLPTGVDPATGAVVPHPGLRAQDLAERLGLHVTTVRFHLDQLVTAGLLRSHFERRKEAGRPRKLYAIEQGSLTTVTSDQSYRMLSELLVETLSSGADEPAGSPEDAGVRWGRRHVLNGHAGLVGQPPARSPGQWLGKIGQMVDLLREWGYSPEVSTTNAGRTVRVALHDCPFLPLAKDNTAVVCGIHRGLMRGVMEALGEESTEVGLTPFVAPGMCIAALTTGSTFEQPASPNHPPRQGDHS